MSTPSVEPAATPAVPGRAKTGSRILRAAARFVRAAPPGAKFGDTSGKGLSSPRLRHRETPDPGPREVRGTARTSGATRIRPTRHGAATRTPGTEPSTSRTAARDSPVHNGRRATASHGEPRRASPGRTPGKGRATQVMAAVKPSGGPACPYLTSPL
ncbi:hypothetical protein GCM10023322_35620 [Rugosimonospora acidiphila]|uniref:Uncharacterized protein n=1 Tax=Rugosimonospora acidiphila TaxID=556531 RepID=A0ABP9RUE5_9ACTN